MRSNRAQDGDHRSSPLESLRNLGYTGRADGKSRPTFHGSLGLRGIPIRPPGCDTELAHDGAFTAGYTRAFDTKWSRSGAPRDEPLLGTPALQSMADLGNSFSIVRNMQLLPIGWSQVAALLLSSAIPMLPLILFAFPVDQPIIGGIKSLVAV
jgi:hypothetical protein